MRVTFFALRHLSLVLVLDEEVASLSSSELSLLLLVVELEVVEEVLEVDAPSESDPESCTRRVQISTESRA
jgi:hypothetical protein